MLAVGMLLTGGACADMELYVSPEGNDANPGTRAKPFATPAAARDAVRKLIAAGLKQDVTVRIAPGTYYLPNGLTFGPQDSGTKTHRITYAAADENRAPILIGGRRVTGFRKHKEGIYVAPLPKGVEPKVAMENGVRLTLAREPNEGYYRTAGAGKGTFTYAGKHFKQLAGADIADAWVNIWPGHGWFNHVWRIKRLDSKTRQVTPIPDSGMGGPPMKNNRFYLQNLLPLLDRPGECVIAASQGKLYVRPRKMPVDKQVYAVATAENVLAIKGAEGKTVRNLHFVGLDLTLAAADAVLVTFAEDCSFRACRVENSWSRGIYVVGANRRITIADSEVRYAGNRGVHLRGANWTGPDISSHHVVENCHIHHCGTVHHDGCGVQIYQSGHNRVVHNHIHHMGRYGTSIKGYGLRFIKDPDLRKRRFDLLHARNNLLAYNHIHHVCQDSEDAGGMESWGPGKGNVYDHNLIHDVGTPRLLLECGIYLDDSSNYFTVTNNVVYGVSASGHAQVAFIKGIHNRIENNVFIASRHCGGAIRSKASGEAAEHTYTRNIVYFEPDNGSQAIYQFDDWVDNRVRLSDFNVFFIPGDTKGLRVAGRTPMRGLLDELWRKRFDKNSLVADPKFVDASKRDYRLRPDSPALKLGIKSIDLSNVGLTDSFPNRLDRE